MTIASFALATLAALSAADAAPPAAAAHVYVAADWDAASTLPDRRGKHPLTYAPATPGGKARPIQQVDGRMPQSKALRLDAGCLVGKAFAVDNGFTVEAWVRLGGQGTLRGNNDSTTGSVFCVGTGYWDGCRVTVQYPAQTLSFSIGRPKPSHAFSVQGGPMPNGAWTHLAAAWDGRQMRLFVQGRLVAAGPFEERYTQSGQFRLGYANAGVGSAILDVDSVTVYPRALTAAEVLAAAHPDANWSAAIVGHLEAMGQGGTTAEELQRRLTELASIPGVSADALAIGRLQLVDALAERGKMPQATADLVAVWASTAAAAHRAAAQAVIVGAIERVDAAALPAKLQQELLDSPALAVDRKRALRATLARRQFHAGQLPAAWAAFESLLDDPAASAEERRTLQTELAHVMLAGGDAAAARRLYSAIADDPLASADARAVAGLAVAETFVREGNAAAAVERLASIASVAETPAHLRREALERSDDIGRTNRTQSFGRTPLPNWPAPSTTFHVAPAGSDDAPGTAERPFATLERARDAIRALKARGGLPPGGVAVQLAAGEYAVRQELTLGVDDSGTPAAPIVYRGAADGQTRLRGGRRLDAFAPVTDAAVRARLPAEARDAVVCSDLASIGVHAGEFQPGGYSSGRGFGVRPMLWLYVDGEAMTLARWPNRGFLQTGAMHGPVTLDARERPVHRDGKFSYHEDRPARWTAEPDAWLYGYWFHDWADSYEKIAAIDPTAKTISLAKPLHGYGFREKRRYYAVNLLCEIDQPGEWWVDRTAGRLYFYPPRDVRRSVVEISELASPFATLQEVSHVRFEKLTWELGRGDGLRIRGGRDCALVGCTLRRLGGDAVSVVGGTGHRIVGCDLHTLARGGLTIEAGTRRTLIPARHLVENCHVYDFSRLHHTYTPAVRLGGVGVRIAHNLFHHSTSSALNVRGNDHEIEYNDVHHVVLESDDQGGLDSFGDPTFRGNVYRYNRWSDIGSGTMMGQAGIRFDDAISGQLVYGNIFIRAAVNHFGGVQIHGGKENTIDNNLFVECDTAVSFSPWSKDRWEEHVRKPQYIAAPQGVDIHSPPYSTRYPELGHLAADANINTVTRNLAVRCGRFLARDGGRQQTADNCVTAADPGFRDAASGDYRLRPDAPGRSWLAWRPIPVEHIGLYAAHWRATWPPRAWPGPGASVVGDKLDEAAK